MITDTARIHFPPYLLISAQDHRGWGKSDAASASYTSARDVILEMGDVEAAYAYIPRDASCSTLYDAILSSHEVCLIPPLTTFHITHASTLQDVCTV
jgi:hypothetical protein